MTREIILFLSALQFFTRLPVPVWVGYTADQLNAASRYFPAIGTLVGVLVSTVLWASSAILPLGMAVMLSMAFGIFITGAFHEDGLTDYADGMGSGFTKVRVLEIMKDSRIGAYGALTIGITLAVKYQALVEIATQSSLFFACAVLVVAHTVSRFAAVSVMWVLPYVREDESSRAKAVVQNLSKTSFAIALLFTIFIAVSCGLACAQLAELNYGRVFKVVGLAILAAAGMWLYMLWRLKVRLQGYTGDCLGATQQLCEATIYVSVAAAIATL